MFGVGLKGIGLSISGTIVSDGGSPLDAFPNASNTGPTVSSFINVPADATSGTGWVWEEGVGTLYINSPDTVLDGYNLPTGGIVIRDTASGATVRNCKAVVVWVEANTTDVTVEYNDVDANHLYGHAAIKFLTGTTNGMIRFNNVTNSENGIRVQGDGTSVLNNYVHDLIDYDAPNDPHIDALELNANNCIVTGNTLLADSVGSNAAITMSAATGCIMNNNYLRGGGYVARIYYDSTTQLTNNYIGPGVFGYYTSDSGGTSTPVVTGNKDADTFANIPGPVVISGPFTRTYASGVAINDDDQYTATGGVGFYSYVQESGDDIGAVGITFTTTNIGSGQFDGAGGFIGTPTTPGTYNVTVRAEDDDSVHSFAIPVAITVT